MCALTVHANTLHRSARYGWHDQKSGASARRVPPDPSPHLSTTTPAILGRDACGDELVLTATPAPLSTTQTRATPVSARSSTKTFGTAQRMHAQRNGSTAASTHPPASCRAAAYMALASAAQPIPADKFYGNATPGSGARALEQVTASKVQFATFKFRRPGGIHPLMPRDSRFSGSAIWRTAYGASAQAPPRTWWAPSSSLDAALTTTSPRPSLNSSYVAEG